MQDQVISGFQLSPQQRDLFLSKKKRGFIAQGVLLIEGAFARERLHHALTALVARYEILHTRFHALSGMDVPLQVVPEDDIPAPTLRQQAVDGEAGAHAVIQAMRDQPFEPGQSDRSIRFDLLTLAPERHWLVYTLPAACADFRSLANLAELITQYYHEGPPAPPVDEDEEDDLLQYLQFSEWQNQLGEEEEDREGFAFWEKRAIAGREPAPVLPVERVPLDENDSFAPELITFTMPPLGGETKAVAFYLACWHLLLSRLSGADQVTLRTWLEGRKFDELQDAVGLLTSAVPLRAEPAEINAGAFLGAVADDLQQVTEWLEFYRWEPGALTEEALAWGFEHVSLPEPNADAWRFLPQHARFVPGWFKLKLTVLEAETECTLRLEYDPNYFDAATVARIAGNFQRLCHGISTDAGRLTAAYPLVPAAETELLAQWGRGPQLEPPPYLSVHSMFQAQAQKTPAQPAVIYEDVTYTFAELDTLSNRIAHHLIQKGVKPGMTVPLFLDRRAEQIAALLGVWKAGAAYMPIDAGQPSGRLAMMLEEADAPVIITTSALEKLLPKHQAASLCLDRVDEVPASYSTETPTVHTNPDLPAYVLYTSGSTGRPKGVVIRHRSILNLAAALQSTIYAGVDGPLRVSVNANLSFDSSVKQLTRLLHGDTLLIPAENVRIDGYALLAFIRDQRLDVLDCTPSQLKILLEAGLETPAEHHLKLALIGGEAIDEALWLRLAAMEPTRFFNVYGPTEGTVNTTIAPIESELGEPTIGKPLPNIAVHLLDAYGNPVPAGCPGELCIAGAGLAMGYAGDPAKTAEKFQPLPNGERLYRSGDLARFTNMGNLAFLGRVDFQVKLRGYRIEMGEIEAVLNQHPGVRDSVVMVREDHPGDQRLVAYAVSGRRGQEKRDGQTRHRLPNDLWVFQQNKNETDYLYEEIFHKKAYAYYGIHLPENALVLDIGANIGMFSLFCLAHQPSTRLYVFEPLAPIYKTLAMNMDLYGDNVKLFNYGLSREETNVSFNYYPRYSMMSSAGDYARPEDEVEVVKRFLEKEAEAGSEEAAELLAHADELLDARFEGETHECLLRRLTDVIREQQIEHIDLLKVDVQRAEMDVLMGMSDADWNKIDQIVMEVHAAKGEESENRVAELRILLEGKGFQMVAEQDELLEGTDRYNVYASRLGLKGREDDLDAWLPHPEFIEKARPVTPEILRGHAARYLPEHMVPGAILMLPKFPFTRTGKVDRKALPAPEVQRAARIVPPETELQKRLVAIWAEVLDAGAMGIQDNFFEKGGHSLLATQLISRVRKQLAVDVPMRVLFDAPTVAAFAAYLEEEQGASQGGQTAVITPAPRDQPLPLSFAQQRLWFIDQLDPGAPIYNTPKIERLRGGLDLDALNRSVNEIVRRHEILRTSFPERLGRPVQAIHPFEAKPIDVEDLTPLAGETREARARELADAEAAHRFDLARGPLFRCRLLLMGPDDYVLMINFHHIITDAWSMTIFWNEMLTLYEAFQKGEPSPLTELELQYADFAYWQQHHLQGDQLEHQLDYWRGNLGSNAPVLNLPLDRPRPNVTSAMGAQCDLRLDGGTGACLNRLCREHEATGFMAVLAAFEALLYRYSGQDDVRIGTVVAGRNHLQTEPMIGFFVNTLVLRGDLSGSPSFSQLLDRCRQEALSAYAHQDIPFEKLVEELEPERDLSHTPLFQVMLSYQEESGRQDDSVRAGDSVADSLTVGGFEFAFDFAKFDLTLMAHNHADNFFLSLGYRTDLFDRATIARLTRHLGNLLRDATANPNKPITQLALLDESETQAMLSHSVGSEQADYAGELLVHQRFELQAERTPDAVALIHQGQAVTYAQLNGLANNLANRLTSAGTRAESRIGLCLERGVEMVVGLLGILKSGGVYVPVDPKNPEARIQFILQDAAVPLLVTSPELAEKTSFTDVEPIFVSWVCTPDDIINPEHVTHCNNGAYIIYTSGTTGQPKGVLVAHRNVTRLFDATEPWFTFDPKDTWTLFHAINFDFSVWELWGALWYGGRLVIVPHEISRSTESFRDLLLQQQVTVLNQTPSAFAALAATDAAKQADQPSDFALRLVIFGGEALDPASLPDWTERYGFHRPRLVNMYGITETTVHVTYHPISETDLQGGPKLIGRPIPDLYTLILDEQLNLMPFGAAGEIHVGGAGVSLGYLNRPDLNAARFIQDPFNGEAGARLYKTGDLGRLLPDGNLVYMGRIDHQVKIRGYRIELGEIEAALTASGGVNEAAVIAVDDPTGKRLVAFTVGECERENLKRQLPEYMIPTAFFSVDALPLTANGKLDRAALTRLAESRQADQHTAQYQAPRTHTERQIAAVWCEVLDLKRVGLHDDFFEIGGHSLLATQVVSRIRAELGVDLPLRTLFEAPVLAELAIRVQFAGSNSDARPSIKPVPRDGRPIPLTFSQQRLWFLDQLQPGGSAYNIPFAMKLYGPLDRQALSRAFDQLIARHEILRTVFAGDAGQAAQVIQPAHTGVMTFEDLADLADEARAQRVAQAVAQAASQPFDLKQGPLFRAQLFRLDDQTHALTVTLHHIISDEWSLNLLVGELNSLYNGAELPPQTLQYADFAHWQREWLQGDVLEAQLAYWRGQLDDTAVLAMPADHPRPTVISQRGAAHAFMLSEALTQKTNELARACGATGFMVLLAAFQTLLHRYSGQNDICTGTPIAGRNHGETESMQGFFINTLAVRSRLNAGLSFRQLIEQVRETTLGAFAHQDVPFEQIVEALGVTRSRSHSPIFQVFFSYHNTPQREDVALSDLECEALGSQVRTAQYDLTLNLNEADGRLYGGLVYSTDLFTVATIERLAEHFSVLLAAALSNPNQDLAMLPLLSGNELDQLLNQWNDAVAPLPAETCLHRLFEARAALQLDAPALRPFEGEAGILSYRELNTRANRLAHHLQMMGVTREAPVAVCLRRSNELIISLLAILKAGGAYVPLDPNYPHDRLGYLLEDSGAGLVVSTESDLDSLPAHQLNFIGAVCLDSEADEIEGQPDHNLELEVLPEQLAYIIYTSGSTGQPKGSMLIHQAVANYVCWASDAYKVDQGEAVPLHTSIAFDATVTAVFPALFHGRCLVLLPEKRELETLDRMLRAEGDYSLIKLTPAHLNALARLNPKGEFAARVGFFVVGGEELTAATVAFWREHLPQTQIVNEYGPTETTVGCAVHQLPEAGECPPSIPIGRAIANMKCYVRDAHGNPSPIGIPGELYIGGVSLARGYLNRPERTAESFVPDPFSKTPGARLYRSGDLVRYDGAGVMTFLGRTDLQVKLRGFRIELGEIENALLDFTREAVVMLYSPSGDESDKRLIAYVTPHGNQVLTGPELRAQLKGKLPEHMVPSLIAVLDEMPLTPNGKIDRAALPEPDLQLELANKYEAPRNAEERLLCGIWAEVLGLERVGVQDNFFDSGGHSLLATRVISRIHERAQVELPLQAIFEAPTVAELTPHFIEARDSGQTAAPPIVPVARDNPLPLSFAQQRLWFLDRLEPNSAAYNIPIALRLLGDLDVEVLRRVFATIVTRHEILRTVFVAQNGTAYQRVLPPHDWTMPLEDLSGQTETEARVKQLVEAEAMRPFDLENGPLFRTGLLKLAEREHVLMLTMHHIVSDGWSMGVIEKEMSALYEAYRVNMCSPLHKLPVQYADFACWQREWLQGEALERQLGFWRERLAGVPVLALPTDRPRPALQTQNGAAQRISLSPELAGAVRELARINGATTFMTLLAAFQVLLYRHAGQKDFAVGTPIANRNRSETEPLIGFFINTLALRAKLDGDEGFTQLLERVRRETLAAYDHQDLPFEKIVDELNVPRDMSHTPLFQVMFGLQNIPQEKDFSMGDLRFEGLGGEHQTAQFDLTLNMGEDGGQLFGSLEYNTDLFDAETMTRFLNHYETLLGEVTKNPTQPIDALNLLTQAEKDQLTQWSTRAADASSPRSDEQPLPTQFTAQAKKTPNAEAVRFENESLTYAQLEQRANQLAHHLQANGVTNETIVGLCLNAGPDLIIALLAVFKAGGVFLPLDPDYPAERLAYMIQDAAPPVVLIDKANTQRFAHHDTLCLDVNDPIIQTLEDQPPPITSRPDNACYALYTSGSTGRPKGAVVSMRAVTTYVQAAQEAFQLQPGERVLQLASISFDVFLEETLPALLSGACVVLRRDRHILTGADLQELVQQQQITGLELSAAHFHQWVDELAASGQTPPKSLRFVIVGCDKIASDRYQTWRQFNVPLIAVFGLTETAITSTIQVLDPSTDQTLDKRALFSIGKPVVGACIHLLGPRLTPVPIGVAGELHLCGEMLGRGYLNRPDLTAERFIPNPFAEKPGQRLYRTGDLALFLPDGHVELLGRIDRQVNLRGFRVELSEIQAVLGRHEQVTDCLITAHESEPGDRRLIAYVIPNADSDHGALKHRLREYLETQLPAYMTPSGFVFLENFPLTPNGKIDHDALPAPGPRDGERKFIHPRYPLEWRVWNVFKDHLKLETLSVNDDFFALGGHSLLAVAIVGAINRFSARPLSVADIFHHPSVEALAGLLRDRENQTQSAETCLITLKDSGDKAPVFWVHPSGGTVFCYAPLAAALGPKRPFHAFQAVGADSDSEPQHLVEDMAAGYCDQLEAFYPEGPIHLGGYSSGGVIAFEMARLLTERGRAVADVALLDSEVWTEPLTEAARAQLLREYRDDPGISEADLRAVLAEDGTYLENADASHLEQFRRYYYIDKANHHAVRAYRPQPYSGSVTLFHRADLNETYKTNWSQVAPKLQAFELPGDHDSLLTPPHVTTLAQHLNIYMTNQEDEVNQ